MANCWSCISARVERSYLSRPNQKHPSWQHCSGSRLNSSKTPAALSPGLFCAPEPVRASAIDNSPSKKQFAKTGGSREPSIARFNVHWRLYAGAAGVGAFAAEMKKRRLTDRELEMLFQCKPG